MLQGPIGLVFKLDRKMTSLPVHKIVRRTQRTCSKHVETSFVLSVHQWRNVQWKSYSEHPRKGTEEATVLLEINADHFVIKTNFLQLVQPNPFHGLENENPYAHINSFKRITSTLRFRNVPNDVIKLMMFPHSLEGAAKSWMNTTSRENVSKTDERIDKHADQLSTLVKIVSKKVVTPAPVKEVEETCVTCGGAHSWYN
ncbi:hypothetical protein Tco_0601182 [Tanacetum coccineum]